MFRGKEKKQANYLFVECKQGKGKIQLEWNKYCGKRVLKLVQYVKGTQWGKKENLQLEKVIRNYCEQDVILYGDEKTVQEFGMRNVLFDARKLEFLQCVGELVRLWDGEMKRNYNSVGRRVKRRSFLIVVDSEEWEYRELVKILTAVKNVYEDVYVLPLVALDYLDKMKEFFSDEYGLMLHIVSEAEVLGKKMNGIFFLVEHWDKCCKRFLYEKGYVVCQWEESMHRVRKTVRKLGGEKYEGMLYSGFVYQWGNVQLPYEIAILLQMQRMLGWELRQEEENPISIVAIYGVE